MSFWTTKAQSGSHELNDTQIQRELGVTDVFQYYLSYHAKVPTDLGLQSRPSSGQMEMAGENHQKIRINIYCITVILSKATT